MLCGKRFEIVENGLDFIVRVGALAALEDAPGQECRGLVQSSKEPLVRLPTCIDETVRAQPKGMTRVSVRKLVFAVGRGSIDTFPPQFEQQRIVVGLVLGLGFDFASWREFVSLYPARRKLWERDGEGSLVHLTV